MGEIAERIPAEIGLFVAAADPRQLDPVSANRYRIDEVVSVIGEPPRGLGAGWEMVRVVRAAPVALPEIPGALILCGTIQHLNYTGAALRRELSARSRGPLPAGEDTRAVVIPIRKTQAWWDLAQDQRQAHFRGDERHTAIGLRFADRIFRTLYHCRYLGLPVAHDFVTYFEFPRACAADFRDLLSQLRDPRQNPEWSYVDHEYEIWMTKIS